MAPKGRKNHYVDEEELQSYLSPDEEEQETLSEVLSKELTPDELAGEMAKSVLINGIPVVGADKVEKLKTKMMETVQQIGQVLSFHLPFDGTSTGGYCFVAFASEDSAKTAMETLNGYKFGKDLLQVYPLSSVEKYEKLSETFQEPKREEYAEDINLLSWLSDGRDQFVVRQGDETIVSWVNCISLNGEVDLNYSGEREKKSGRAWCKKNVQWSPLGSYLTTVHVQGLKIWGGDDFSNPPRGKFGHDNCSHFVYSPCERYLISWDGTDSEINRDALIVWSVKSGKKIRSFKVVTDHAVDRNYEWPIMKWNSNGSYFARIIENGISLFETPTMKLADKPVPAKGITSFEWSPTDPNLLAFYSPESGNIPARVVLMNPLTRQEITSKNLFNVSSIKLIWHPQGDFLCANCVRHSKTGKTLFTSLEFFRIRDDNITNEMLEFKTPVSAFAFEPNGTKFCTLLTEKNNCVMFHDLCAVKNGENIKHLVTLENKSCNQIHWSPVGGVCILAGLGEMNGKLEFYDTEEKQTTATVEHFMCNEIHWDPSGRLVATCVTQPMTNTIARFTLENGYKLWTFQGKKLNDYPAKDFYSFSFRPRPKTLLKPTDVEEIKKKLPSLIKSYEKEDALVKKRKQAAANEIRVKQLIEFRELLRERKKDFLAYEDQRKVMGLPLLLAEDLKSVEISELVEELISEKTEKL